MKGSLILIALSILSMLVKGQGSQEIERIKHVVNAFQEDFNDGGFIHANDYTTADWTHINPLGGIEKGRERVLQEVRAVHQSFLKGVTMQIESMDVRFLSGDVAIADVIHKVGNFTTPDGVKHENERQIKTYVIVKQKGKWLLTQDHNTIIQESGQLPNQR